MRTVYRIIFTFSLLPLSCSDDEDNLVLITGEVSYVSDNERAKNVPLKLTIYNEDIPFDRSNPNNNIVQIIKLRSDNEGLYSQEINLTLFPNNLTYSIFADTSTLVNMTENYIPSFCSSIPPLIPEDRRVNSGRIFKNILVDHSTFFQISFQKNDHNSLDKILYCFCLCGRETTIASPDTVFIDKLPFSYHPKISLSYDLIRESGDIEEYFIQDIALIKNDTTKIEVNY